MPGGSIRSFWSDPTRLGFDEPTDLKALPQEGAVGEDCDVAYSRLGVRGKL